GYAVPKNEGSTRIAALQHRCVEQHRTYAGAAPSVLRLVDQLVGGDPGHHRAQLLADLLDVVLGGAPAHRLEAGVAGGVLEHPVAREAAGLDVVEDALHLGLDVGVDEARAARVVAVLGGVGDRVAHIGDATLVDEVDDQLDLVQALEIGHLGRVAGIDERLVAGLDEGGEPAAQHRLLAEEVGLAFLLEAGLDDAGAPAADRRGVGQGDLERIAGGVLVDGDQAGHAAAAHIFRAHGVAGTL